MPIYELLCKKCKKVSDHLLAVCEDDTVVKCPKCKTGLTREANRTWTTPVAIKGDTCSKE